MAAEPVPTESRSTTGDTEALQFQRLERVRAQRRLRRRYRWFLTATLAIALAGAGVMGFIAIRRTSFERLRSSSSRPPVEMVKPAVAVPAAKSAVPGPPLVDVSRPAGAETVRRGPTRAPRVQAEADREPGAIAPLRDEPSEADAVDPVAAIDWLLKGRGPDATRVPNGGEEKLQ